MTRKFRPDLAAAGTMLLVAFFSQLWSIDYGTRVNDVPYVANFRSTTDLVAGSALNRDIVVSAGRLDRERPELWATRFKLYSIEADEIVNIIALARINQHRTRPDPGFYQYGGAYIYPLGAWYFALTKAHVLDISSLQSLLEHPQRMDRVWIFGRLFTLLAFFGSAVLFFLSVRSLATPRLSLLLLALYVLCPGSVLFSQIMKPHWYALLWVNLALYALAEGFQRRRLSLRLELCVALGLGLAIGSAVTFALFAVLVFGALIILVRRQVAPALSLARIPLVAFGAFAATNPYLFLNTAGVAAERASAKAWFDPTLSWESISSFVDNSLFTSLGLALTVVMLLAVFASALRPSSTAQRLFAVSILLTLLFGAVTTSTIANWHTNIRYVAYVLPAGLLLLAAFDWPHRSKVLAATLIATVAQTFPLKLAYLDENDPVHSTRLAAAGWIDGNIPVGDSICVGTTGPAPYDVPPFQLSRYGVNKSKCRWSVLVERETDSAAPVQGSQLVERFHPRLSPQHFPLVIGHINPQISVYRLANPTSAAAL